MSGADKAAAIREKAERLAGRSLGENGDALTEMAMERACAWCGREDIPEAMEQAVAASLSLSPASPQSAVMSCPRAHIAPPTRKARMRLPVSGSMRIWSTSGTCLTHTRILSMLCHLSVYIVFLLICSSVQ